MSDQDYENTIARLDDQIADLLVENAHLKNNQKEPTPLEDTD